MSKAMRHADERTHPHQRGFTLLEVMVAQINQYHGGRLMPRLMRYQQERKDNLQRWIDGLTKLSAPTSIYWGVQDPVAVVAMADRIKLWSPTTDVYKIKSSGHWPSIEGSDVIDDAIIARLPLYDN